MRTTIIILCYCAAFVSLAQNQDLPLGESLVGKDARVNMYHNFADLEKLNKDILVRIYTSRVIALEELIPFCALNSEKAKTLETMGIPDTKTNVKLLSNYVKSKQKFETHLQETMSKTSSYAEKDDLIDMILLIERFISEIKSHFN